jgi:hypothetical protein
MGHLKIRVLHVPLTPTFSQSAMRYSRGVSVHHPIPLVAPLVISLARARPAFKEDASAMMASAGSVATTLGHVAAKKSPATSVLHVGVSIRIAFPVQAPFSDMKYNIAQWLANHVYSV